MSGDSVRKYFVLHVLELVCCSHGALDKITGIVKGFCLLKESEKANIVVIEMQKVDSVRGSSPHME